jgi:hypothetical protein
MPRYRNPRYAPEWLERKLSPGFFAPTTPVPVVLGAPDPEPDPPAPDPNDPYPTDPIIPEPDPLPPIGPAVPA